MHLRFLLLVSVCLVCVKANEPKTHSRRSYKDDLYLEEEGVEGSGRNDKDDTEASGSDYGVDDEDGEPGSGDRDDLPTTPILLPGTTTDKEILHNNNNPRLVDKTTIVPDIAVQETIPREHPKSDIDKSVIIMNPKSEDRPTSFFAQPGILAAVVGGAVVGLLCAILVVMFIVYRMRKKDEGSYALDEPKRSPASNLYGKSNQREFFA